MNLLRFGYIAPLGFGLLLVYMGVFGLQGFGLNVTFSLSRLQLPTIEQFQNLSVWTSQNTGSATATIQSVGASDGSSVFLDSSNGGIAEIQCSTVALTYNSITQWTGFFNVKIVQNGFGFIMKYMSGTYLISMQITYGTTATFSDGSIRAVTVDNDWHLICLQVTQAGSAASVNAFIDAKSIGSFNSVAYTGVNPNFVLEDISGAQVYVDYLELDSGLLTAPTQVSTPTATSSPPPTNNPSTGSLVVTCTKGGSGLQGVTVTITNAGQTSAGPYSASSGADGVATISSITPGMYHVQAGKTGETLQSPSTLSDMNIAAGSPTTLSLVFAGSADTQQWTIGVAQSSGGTITASPTAITAAGFIYVPAGQSETLTVNVKNPSFTISTVTVDGQAASQPYTAPYTYTFPAGTTDTHTFSATFSNGTSTINYTIHASADAHGSISPQGDVNVASGASQQFVIMANAGYKVASVTVDNSPYSFASGALSVTYNGFTNIMADHTISASFTSTGSSSGNDNGGGNTTIPTFTFNIDWNGIWKNINSIVDANRQPLLAVGGLISLFSFIGLLLPTKRIPIAW